VKFFYTKRFKASYKKLPLVIQKKFDKQIKLLEHNFRHPSLQIKKIQGFDKIWEARVDYHYRFTFNLENEMIILRTIRAHDKVLESP
jgi:mRNA-degrading endonuclease RelE of RelBE toxin-antitoxin system